jgi:hypothetical protein
VFTFAPEVPSEIHRFLVPLIQAWINRADHAVFAFETTRYGLVSFRRTPWPLNGAPTVVAPAGEVDVAALINFAESLQENPDGLLF